MKHLRAITLRLALALSLAWTLGLPVPFAGLPSAMPAAEAQPAARFSPAQAAALVQKQVGGKVLKVDTFERGGRVIYRVKILQQDGRIRTLNVDGQSGKVLKQQ
ncbi:PepSY domain-containing protein [Marinimicrobium agarilyticum]|uniref:PepSY domain-containing protein n=1 Tax=Marinimicrobium agarilyticum TaxID=306546 RepID=UPI00040D89D3|nr:PepSY domain-containing protein [Marinimicrobium agarilyticum]